MTTTKHDRRIFLGMPGYGKQTAEAGEGYWCACEDDTHLTRDNTARGSLLAANFNSLWCKALNIVHSGGRLDYFAMLHDDIGPGKFWLDKLIDELEAKQLDVLSVVVPIKDQRGLTSTAVHKDGNNWRTECRLTMHDLYELPETFTSDDLGGKPLLLNTGCWVMKWNQELCRQFHFEINDRIVFDRGSNQYSYENESEDWYLSRLMHEHGLKIGATRKIAVQHRGEIDYLNSHVWGQYPVDMECVVKSPVPNAFPHDVPGWLSPDEGKQLAQLASGKRVLEIGSYCGRSTVCMARTAEHVTAVDYFDGRDTTEPQDTLKVFTEMVKRHGVESKVETCDPDSELPLAEYDFCFIDGSHQREAVERDIEKCLRVLSPNGLIAFHDYHRPTDRGVTEAVDAFVNSGAEIISLTNTLAVVKPPALIPLEV
jgi:predicted O-methyltransferase YrrM